jgi:polyhydroxybutyrate depolymerase
MKLAWLVVLAACGGSDSERPVTFGGDRPTDLKIPPDFDAGRDYPLVVALHGYSANGFVQAAYFGLTNLVADNEILLLAPDGTLDSSGKLFWNADPACCDFDGKNPDDVGYIGRLIEDVSAAYPVDKQRVYLVGHSNGGFMAYRMACERADLIAGIAGLAGAAASVPSSCTPSRSVNVLHIHGTADTTVPYAPGGLGVGAEQSVAQWAAHDGCGVTLTAGAQLDIETIPGSETQTLTAACPATVAVELWKVEGAGHVPSWGPAFTPTLWKWLEDHPRK